jgi:hypothetical protein
MLFSNYHLREQAYIYNSSNLNGEKGRTLLSVTKTLDGGSRKFQLKWHRNSICLKTFSYGREPNIKNIYQLNQILNCTKERISMQ